MTKEYEMPSEIPDGKIHPIDEYNLYILMNHLGEINADSLSVYQYEFLRKYAEYIYEVNREKSISLIQSFLLEYTFDYQMIYRPAAEVNILSSHSKIALKMKRYPNDEKYFEK